MGNCFKIHEHPNWYKTLKQHKMKGLMRENFVGTLPNMPLDCNGSDELPHDNVDHFPTSNNIDLSSIIKREIGMYLKDKGSFT